MIPVSNPTPAQLFQKQMQAFQSSPRQRAAVRAWRYYDGTAYNPEYGRQFPHPYTEWDEVKNGPRPTVWPLSKQVVENSAQFLFGAPLQLQVGDPEDEGDDTLQKFIDDVITANQIQERYLPEARKACIEGATVWKWAWTPDNKDRPVAVQFLSPWQVKFFREPLDADVVYKARIDLKYVDDDEQWWLYREEWTNLRLVVYEKLRVYEHDDTPALAQFNMGQWPIEYTEANPFGMIPMTLIYNRRMPGDYDGYGDYWEPNSYRMMDVYNHTRWLEHHSNQLDGNPTTVIVNSRTFDGRPAPGEILKVDGEGADVRRIEGGNELRPSMRDFANDVKREFLKACGTSEANPEEVTNKGNLTRQVWEFIFAPDIAKAKEKRLHWGDCGLKQFYQNMMLGLSRLPDAPRLFPALRKVNEKDKASYDVTILWGDLYRTTPEERSATIKDAALSVENAFLTQDRAVQEVAKVWNITDVTALREELDKDEAVREAQEQKALDQARSMLKQNPMAGQQGNKTTP